MNFDKYTDRARGFVQSAQSLALREGHQQFAPEHLLKVLLDDPEGVAAGLIDRAGGRSREALTAVEAALARRPKVEGAGAGQLYIDPALARIFDAAEKAADATNAEKVDTTTCCWRSPPARTTTPAGRWRSRRHHPQSQEPSRRRASRRSSAMPAIHQAARDGRRSGDRRDEEIRRTIQVLSRRTKNNRCRSASRAPARPRSSRLAQRIVSGDAPESLRQEAARARHGRADRRRKYRGEFEGAQGRAAGGHLVGRRHHPVHRRDAHPGRRRQGGRCDGRLQPAQTRAGAQLHCIGATTLSTSTRSTSRDARWRGASSRCSCRSRAWRTRSRSCAGSRTARAAPRAHHRQRDRGRRDAVAPLHHRPLPARQGDRLVDEAAARLKMQVDPARGARLARPRDRAPEDRAGGAEEGERPGSKERLSGFRRADRAEKRSADLTSRWKAEKETPGGAEAQSQLDQLRTEPPHAAARRVPAPRARLRPHSSSEAPQGDRSVGRQGRDGAGGGHRRPHGAGRRAGPACRSTACSRARRRSCSPWRRSSRAAWSARPRPSRRCRPRCGARAGAGSAPADRLVHVPRSHRRRQDRAYKALAGFLFDDESALLRIDMSSTWRSTRWRG